MKSVIETSRIQKVFRMLLALLIIFAGFSHLTFNRIDLQAQVPDWVAFSKDVVVLLSGIVEIGLGLALLFWKKQCVRLGWALALFFVLVFPGNIAQYLDGKNVFGLLNTDNA